MPTRPPINRTTLHRVINQQVKVRPGILLAQNQRVNHIPGKRKEEVEINMVKQHLVSMHQTFGTNSQKTAGLPKPSLLLNHKTVMFAAA